MLRSLPAPVQRWVAILLPPLAIAVCCFVMIPRQSKLRETHKEIVAAQASVQDYLRKLQAISDLPPDPRVASLPMNKQEQSDFLRDLSTLCYRTGNRIVSLTSLAAPATAAPPPGPQASGQSGQQAKGASAAAALPPDVTPIKSTVVFEGRFGSLRSFLSGLQQSRRLVSMTDCRVMAGHGGYPVLQTTLTVTRYVDLPSAAPAPAQAADARPVGPSS